MTATPSGTEGVERKDDVKSFVGQNADLEDVDLSFEESSTPSSETDSEHEEQLGMSLKNLPGNLMSSQQGHFEQVAQSTKNCPDSVDSEAIRALKTQLGGKHFIRTKKQRVGEMHRLSLEISKKSQSTGMNGTNSSCANEWEHTVAKPKSNVPGAPSSSVPDNKVLAGQSHVEDIHKQLGSGGPSIGFSLHGASNRDHSRDVTGTLSCALPPLEQGRRQTTAHGPQQPRETPKLSLEPECIDTEGMSNSANEWNGLPHETPACGINPEFLAQHSTDPLLGGYTTSSAGESNTQNHLIQLEQNEVHCMQQNMPSEQDDIVRWSSTSMERERVARRWCSCCRDDPDSMPICEVCYRHRYCGPGYHPQMNRVDLCCHCFEEAIGQCIMLPCRHKVHKDCVIAAIRFNILNCPTCGRPFLYLV